jgi:hypothetical protein
VIAAAVVASFALTASPSRVELPGSGTQIVEVRNRGAAPIVLDATRAGFTLDLSGHPRVIPVAPAAWLSVRPKRVALAPGATAKLTIAGRVLHGASPGDHTALLLLSTRAPKNAGVGVRMRLGIVVVLRVPGRVVHRLTVESLRTVGGQLRIALANRGNVTEQLTGRRVVVTVRRGARVLVRLYPSARELLPRSRGVLTVRVPASLRGALTVEVAIRPSVVGGAAVTRSFRTARRGP